MCRLRNLRRYVSFICNHLHRCFVVYVTVCFMWCFISLLLFVSLCRVSCLQTYNNTPPTHRHPKQPPKKVILIRYFCSWCCYLCRCFVICIICFICRCVVVSLCVLCVVVSFYVAYLIYVVVCFICAVSMCVDMCRHLCNLCRFCCLCRCLFRCLGVCKQTTTPNDTNP